MDESMDLKDLRFRLDPVKLNRHRISVQEIRPLDLLTTPGRVGKRYGRFCKKFVTGRCAHPSCDLDNVEASGEILRASDCSYNVSSLLGIIPSELYIRLCVNNAIAEILTLAAS